MAGQIAILEGWKEPMPRHRKRKAGGSQRAKFKRAARACRGKTIRSFRACMRKHLKKGSRSRGYTRRRSRR